MSQSTVLTELVPLSSTKEESNEILKSRFNIVIPAYNEEKRIFPVLKEITEFITAKNLPWKIIVAVDGNDGTADIVRSFSDRFDFVSLNISTGRNGKGGAIKRTLTEINGEFVILMDADNSIDFPTVLAKIPLIEDSDVIILSRYNDKSEIPFLRRFLSRGFNLLVSIFTDLEIKDTQSGYKIFRSEKFVDAMKKVGTTNTFYDISLLYHIEQDGGKILEVKTPYRHDDGSKFHPLGEVMGQGISLAAFVVRHSRFYRHIPGYFIDLYYKKFRWI